MAHVIKKLIAGNKQFRERFFEKDPSLFNMLVQEGQKPKTLVIACSDSRVEPAMIFNCQPGELFSIRSVANLVPPCEDANTYHGTSAALEFGTCFLGIEHIIILGHTQCGGIRALIENTDSIFGEKQNSFIAKWMEIARPAYNRVIAHHEKMPLEEKIILCEQYTLINSLHNLQSFPWICERVRQGALTLHAWYFDLQTGFIHQYDQDNNTWFC